jgi:hypothetical protein
MAVVIRKKEEQPLIEALEAIPSGALIEEALENLRVRLLHERLLHE